MSRTRPHHPDAKRRVDGASLLLALVGLGCLVLVLTTAFQDSEQWWRWLMPVPSLLAIGVGLSHLTKWEAPRDLARPEETPVNAPERCGSSEVPDTMGS
ncbi:hypothetical protein [Nocardioides sp. Leaf285]|uniref:hypothetical protein n=1 Tax=Nocardioides sp. Leaf285 TaxID=1736322 RepID=UPI0007027A80|nr:hypothetical protein [Nocardioides sp. Leaf285]KQP63027.1 hypothetical protein ASF47_18620 [Nocardioides sp. Leaf285]